MRQDFLSHLKKGAYLAGRWILDQALPPRCLSCGEGTLDPGRICPSCWKGLSFLQGSCCACCGYPFDFTPVFASENEVLCGACQKKHPPFDRARAALRYDDGSRKMIISFKHGDRLEYGDFFVQLLLQTSHLLQDDDPIIIPIPLHRKRLQKRRYNQAAVLAQKMANRKNLIFLPDVLIRQKHTPPQEGNYHRRKRNVAGAFSINPRYEMQIKDRNIILVDDVYTTGATVRACARVLKKNHVAAVEVLTLARVCQPSGL